MPTFKCCKCGGEFTKLLEKRKRVCPLCTQTKIEKARKLRAGGTCALSPTHKTVARMVSHGLSNKVIAHEMGLTYGSLKEYLYIIFAQMGVENRTELAVKWVRENSL